MTVTLTLGLDLAGKPKNPTGWATLEGRHVKAGEVYTDKEIIGLVESKSPMLTAIDSPLSLPREGLLRKADKEMIRHGYRVFPPRLPAMEKLTKRAIKLTEQITKRGFRVIEVHPTSTRKALGIPTKEWRKIQDILAQIGLKGEHERRTLTPHEIDAVTAALTARLHIEKATVKFGDEEEGYIIVPKPQDWRQIQTWKHGT